MATNQQQKGSSRQIDVVEKPSKRGAGLEQERAGADGQRELEERVRKLESAMEDFVDQISDLRREVLSHSKRDCSYPEMETPFSDPPELVNWLPTGSLPDKAEMQKKKEALDIIVTTLMP